ncbi:OmpA family protein [Oceanivirga miroungae]|uniref:OmpA/MotB domain-containing protein n=1 Tax=Oceanivirga miroungae TaxID=1130046 RepID=A0A6I8MBT5_9FUSO|nr:OmpA family protein [Oceanivirga miroungae]VWL84887.1 OmpA/MotB domain-containing protein [Oceanivirga miroungae]
MKKGFMTGLFSILTANLMISNFTYANIQDNEIKLKHLSKEVTDFIDKTDKNNGGVASLVAQANIPQVAGDKKFSVGAGVSYYDKNGGVALGLSGQDKNRRVIYKATAGVSFNGSFSIGAGINYNFGKTNEEKTDELEDVYAKLNAMGDEVKKIEAENVELSKKLPKKEIKYIISDFDLDKSDVKKMQKEKLESVVELINTNYADGTVEITGFTDRAYYEQYNLDLGLRRAKNAKEMLMNLGLSKDAKILIRSKAFNEISDGTPADLRRVEIKISDTIIY